MIDADRWEPGLNQPAHLLSHDSHRQGTQSQLLALPWPEAIREAEKVPFIDGVQYFYRGSLYDFILQHWNTNRSLLCIGFRYVRPLNRLRPVRSPFQPWNTDRMIKKTLVNNKDFTPLATPRKKSGRRN
jgi:hypothetical protein